MEAGRPSDRASCHSVHSIVTNRSRTATSQESTPQFQLQLNRAGMFNMNAPTAGRVAAQSIVFYVANQGPLPRTAIREITWGKCDGQQASPHAISQERVMVAAVKSRATVITGKLGGVMVDVMQD